MVGARENRWVERRCVAVVVVEEEEEDSSL